ncbi:MAG: hypothetical protein WBP45_05675 [Daejeonella sp.]
MKKLFIASLILGFIFLLQTETKAQNYKNAIGVRLGAYNGLNFKTFLNNKAALDLNLSFRGNSGYNRFLFTGLYEVHNQINNAAGLKWYYGGGGSIGSYRYKNSELADYVHLSLDGVLGLDYKFNGAPINLALDWRPRLLVTPDTDIYTGDVGLAIRFTF